MRLTAPKTPVGANVELTPTDIEVLGPGFRSLETFVRERNCGSHTFCYTRFWGASAWTEALLEKPVTGSGACLSAQIPGCVTAGPAYYRDVAIAVFIENPAGLSLKHHFDERRGTLRAITSVSRPYPFPYGFVLRAPAADGDNLDCFVLTRRQFNPGDLVECEVLGLMEQWEDALVDHNVIARPVGETSRINDAVQATLVDFVTHVFDHIPGKVIRAGRFLDANEAHRHVVALQSGDDHESG